MEEIEGRRVVGDGKVLVVRGPASRSVEAGVRYHFINDGVLQGINELAREDQEVRAPDLLDYWYMPVESASVELVMDGG